jgi:glyoxylase-like metal-dependent hydrolase (beta-lactamase superfamily II)
VASDVHCYRIGDIAVTVLPDGFRMTPTDNYLANAGKEELIATLASAGLPTGEMRNTYAPVVLETKGKRVLIDTGNGEAMLAQSKGERGHLRQNLAAAGIDPTTIDTVVISHFHADHVNGLIDAASKPAFPNAEIKVPENEWVFWMDDGEMSRAPKGRMTELFHNNRRVFDALGRKVTRFAWDTEVAGGVTAVGTPGHSIGHTSFVVASGGKQVLVQGDVLNHVVVFAKHPDWQGWFDQDGAQAAATRRRVYDMLVAEQMPVQAYHHPFPGLGRVEKDGSGYRVIAMS